jgi:hypothetical protein
MYAAIVQVANASLSRRSISRIFRTALAIVWTHDSSAGVAGRCSARKASRRAWNSGVVGGADAGRKPCLQELRLDAALPRAVRGPVLRRALARLAAMRAGLAAMRPPIFKVAFDVKKTGWRGGVEFV